ncbi:spinster family MFS transporter [Sphingomonas sp.]|uniref:spinster family MFS transporter n=1 Tax=Sphingomonas sp. TaxID=28214 RepID=UPI003D6C7D31
MSGTATVQPAGAAVWHRYSPARRWGLLAILFLVSLSNYVDRQVMSVLIEPIKAEFQASDTMMGLLSGFAFAACYAVLGIPVARLSDRGNRRIVITLSLAIWSMMSVACGFARNFTMLALARTGVGVGEAGAIPPAQSLIADYFPPEQRTRALGIFMASATVGYLIAFMAGTQLAATYGWRMAFIALGLPGLLLAALAWLGLHEPRAGRSSATAQAQHETFRQTLRALADKPSYVFINVSMALYFLVAYGAITWLPAYMGRVLRLELTEIGAAYGAVSALGALVGTLGGGFVIDRLAKRNPRQLAQVPGLILIASCPLYELGLLTNTFGVFLAMVFIAGVGLSAAAPAMFSALHLVCGSARRAMAVAIAFFFANLLGLGFGPLITGALSDLFTAQFGPVGLRYALMAALALLIPAGIALWLGGRTLEADREA